MIVISKSYRPISFGGHNFNPLEKKELPDGTKVPEYLLGKVTIIETKAYVINEEVPVLKSKKEKKSNLEGGEK